MANKKTSKTQKKMQPTTTEASPRSAPAQQEEFAVAWAAIQRLGKDVDEHQVNELTDHVFSSVLSRFGWTRNEQGHLEKTGIEEAA
jgi:hypothetical protein